MYDRALQGYEKEDGYFSSPINYESESTYEDSTITDPKERENIFAKRS